MKFNSEADRDKIISLLEQNMNDEFAATLQYVCHRISAQGRNQTLAEAFKSAALDEMAHILFFSDLITKMGGVPRFSDWSIDKSDDIKTMIEQDIRLETSAIDRYTRQLDELAAYPEIYSIIENVIIDEKDHMDIFSDYLSKIKSNRAD